MRKFCLLYLFYISLIQATNAQTRFLDCTTETPIQNAKITHSQTNEWLGNTNENGEVVLPKNINSINITHPNFGTLSVNSYAIIVCIDNNTTTLKELTIESGEKVKKQLLATFENSYKTFKNSNKGKRYYQIDFNLQQSNNILESFHGILAFGNLFNTNFNNYTLYWTKDFNNNKTYEKLPSYEYISHTEEAIFTDKKMYQQVKKYIENNQVQKIGNEIMIYSKNDEDFITFIIDEEKQLISKYQNTKVLKRRKPYRFTDSDLVLMGNVEVNFNTENEYFINTLTVQEKYLINQSVFESNSFIKQLKLSKEEQKNLNGNGIFKFVSDYVQQKNKSN